MSDKSFIENLSLSLVSQSLATDNLIQSGIWDRLMSNVYASGKTSVLKKSDPMAQALTGTMRADSVMYRRASANINEASALMRVAATSTGTLVDNLKKMQDLATQYADTSKTPDQKTAIKSEYDSLGGQINSTVKNASFNGIQVLDGSNWGSDERIKNGAIHIQAGNSGFKIQLHDIKSKFDFTSPTTAIDAAGITSTLSSMSKNAGLYNSLYTGRVESLDSQAKAYMKQADTLDSAVKNRTGTWQELDQDNLIKALLTRDTGTISNTQA